VVVMALGWVLFDEGVSPLQGVGAAVVIAGVVLAQRSRPSTSLSAPSPG